MSDRTHHFVLKSKSSPIAFVATSLMSLGFVFVLLILVTDRPPSGLNDAFPFIVFVLGALACGWFAYSLYGTWKPFTVSVSASSLTLGDTNTRVEFVSGMRVSIEKVSRHIWAVVLHDSNGATTCVFPFDVFENEKQMQEFISALREGRVEAGSDTRPAIAKWFANRVKNSGSSTR